MSEAQKETGIIEELKEKFGDEWNNMPQEVKQEEIDRALYELEQFEDSINFISDEDEEDFNMLEGLY